MSLYPLLSLPLSRGVWTTVGLLSGIHGYALVTDRASSLLTCYLVHRTHTPLLGKNHGDNSFFLRYLRRVVCPPPSLFLLHEEIKPHDGRIFFSDDRSTLTYYLGVGVFLRVLFHVQHYTWLRVSYLSEGSSCQPFNPFSTGVLFWGTNQSNSK